MIQADKLILRPALPEEHADLCRLAKTSKWTRDYSNHMFSGSHAYAREWIWGAYEYDPADGNERCLGFFCVRHKSRTPATTLYFIVVNQTFQRCGVGQKLLDKLKELAPHPKIDLNVGLENSQARAFYARNGFLEVGSSLFKVKSDGSKEATGVALTLEWKK